MARTYLSPPHMGSEERALLLEAFDSNWIAPLGPQVEAFEAEFASALGVRHAVALSSGTAALHLGLKLMGVGPGDEVVVSSFTFAASVNPIVYLGAQPVLVDSEKETWNLDPQLVEDAIQTRQRAGAKVKAIVSVDLYGQCANYQSLVEISERTGVPLLEDAAEALGASHRGMPAGRFGAAAAFSFNGNKIITTSGGGMLVSDRKEWIDEARFLATQARDPAPHYQHSTLGYNYRLSNLLAAVGRGQLGHLKERVAARQAHRQFYESALGQLPGLGFMPLSSPKEWNGWLTVITVDAKTFGASAEDLRLALEAQDIESRPVWKPMHLQPYYRGCPMFGGSVSEAAFETGLCLPSGSNLTEVDRQRVVDVVLRQHRQAPR